MIRLWQIIVVSMCVTEYFAMASEDLQKRLSLSIIRVALPGDVIWRPFLVLLVLFSLLPLLSGTGMRPASFRSLSSPPSPTHTHTRPHIKFVLSFPLLLFILHRHGKCVSPFSIYMTICKYKTYCIPSHIFPPHFCLTLHLFECSAYYLNVYTNTLSASLGGLFIFSLHLLKENIYTCIESYGFSLHWFTHVIYCVLQHLHYIVLSFLLLLKLF